MKKFLKWIAIILGGLFVLLFIAFKIMQANTKKHSPEDTVVYTQGEMEMSVFYNRPSKKGRDIFGGLVPYGEVWRTGANEATTFETNRDITFGGQPLPAGKYTLWTIPGPNTWTVIINDKMYGWGVGFQGASREAEYDVLKVDVPVQKLDQVVEQFTIAFEQQNGLALTLMWDQTKVAVPIE